MLARLWWKDARQFWPIWALMAFVALAAQWVAMHYYRDDSRTGGLAFMALGWTCLYAFAVAAAAFAGERETRTLHLLDALPVERWRLWTAKVSFALVSTLALGLFLFAVAATGTDSWQSVKPWGGFFAGLVILLLVLGCGLFWSAALSNALLAGVLGVFSALLVAPTLNAWLGLNLEFGQNYLLQAAIATGALLGSGVLFLRSGPPRRPMVRPAAEAARSRPAETVRASHRLTGTPPRLLARGCEKSCSGSPSAWFAP